ncbi:dickkopf-like protein 1 [Amblyraja radiata]|uniref:dickkopf-like protein 1 n=1 Tax=Amblyraja radiata TaxID=386614 RepID=UPI001403246D|nr:dickkopf-like protein 1 [Amblyraja radiata]
MSRTGQARAIVADSVTHAACIIQTLGINKPRAEGNKLWCGSAAAQAMMLHLAVLFCLPFLVTAAPAALEAKSESDGFVKVVDFDSLPLNYHDEENEEELVGDKIFHKYEKIDKETDDITGDTILSEREVIEEDDDDFPEKRVGM